MLLEDHSALAVILVSQAASGITFVYARTRMSVFLSNARRNDGNLGTGTGLFVASWPGNALALGYATVSTDAGRNNATNTVPDAGNAAAFGLDPEARLEYGYKAIGEPPRYSYIMGCSNGGREAMIAATRFRARARIK